MPVVKKQLVNRFLQFLQKVQKYIPIVSVKYQRDWNRFAIVRMKRSK